MIAFAGKF